MVCRKTSETTNHIKWSSLQLLARRSGPAGYEYLLRVPQPAPPPAAVRFAVSCVAVLSLLNVCH